MIQFISERERNLTQSLVFRVSEKIRSILIARKSVQRLRVVSDSYIFKTIKIPERMS